MEIRAAKRVWQDKRITVAGVIVVAFYVVEEGEVCG